uniref:Kinesin-like protein KIF24 n=1 Tax=Lygus hesperus TaxID=30085 RepID=A0A0A9X2X4_LYGHE
MQELLQTVLRGGRASCFAYGQTGSGKTYTMMGNDFDSSNSNSSMVDGLYLLGAKQLFAHLSSSLSASLTSEKVSLQVAFYEIYCNSCFDLLNERHPVQVREDNAHRMHICHLT